MNQTAPKEMFAIFLCMYIFTQAGFHPIGSAASVKQITSRSHPRPQFSLLLIGQCRIRIDNITQEVPYAVAKVTQLDNSGLTQSVSQRTYIICVQWKLLIRTLENVGTYLHNPHT